MQPIKNFSAQARKEEQNIINEDNSNEKYFLEPDDFTIGTITDIDIRNNDITNIPFVKIRANDNTEQWIELWGHVSLKFGDSFRCASCGRERVIHEEKKALEKIEINNDWFRNYLCDSCMNTEPAIKCKACENEYIIKHLIDNNSQQENLTPSQVKEKKQDAAEHKKNLQSYHQFNENPLDCPILEK
ncbi:MAG: hypothetical protein ACTSYF_04585, partial [Promethearchaeota archaeon]